MKYIALASLLSAFFIAGCGQSSNDDEQPTDDSMTEAVQDLPAGEPVTLHARLDFIDAHALPSIDANRQLKASIYLATDAIRYDEGAEASFSPDGEIYNVQGSIVAEGKMLLDQGDVATKEHYGMSNQWSSITKNPDGVFLINMPEPSMIGEGFSVGVEIDVPVSGTKQATITSNGQTIESELNHARTMFCYSQTEQQEACKLKFTIDAIPTEAKDPAYAPLLESAKDAYNYQGKQGPDGGLIIFSDVLPVYGATTRYENGHFVTSLKQEFTVTLDGSEMNQKLNLVVWSTKRGDSWQPEEATPLR